MTNPSTLWASILVDELVRCGVRHTVIAPGSRSTPLTLALSRREEIALHVALDERAAAFLALGIGKASGQPAVVVCTSGTAAANFFPAIVEADAAHVPLIALTADRPHDLRGSGANQTIDQVKLYGDRVRFFVDLAPPEPQPSDRTLRSLRTTVDRAVAYAAGGPVHINAPFRKPLEPTPHPLHIPEGIGAQGREDGSPFTSVRRTESTPIEPAVEYAQRPVIIAGPGADTSIEGDAPLLAEPLSGVRCGPVISGYETFLRGEVARALKPDLIVQMGAMPVSKALLDYLDLHGDVRRIVVSERLHWPDGDHHAAEVVSHPPRIAGVDPAWAAEWEALDRLTWGVILDAPPNEGSTLRDVADLLPPGSTLFVASSSPVRHLDQFTPASDKPLTVLANRGTSGIDGTIASALGAAIARKGSPAALVLGDLALYHDLNSLHLVRQLSVPLVIVVINNDGGGIFHRLPITEYEPPFRALFQTPHGLTFEHAAALFDLPYTCAKPGAGFRSAFEAALNAGEPHLIEVPSDAALFEQQRRDLINHVQRRITAAQKEKMNHGIE